MAPSATGMPLAGRLGSGWVETTVSPVALGAVVVSVVVVVETVVCSGVACASCACAAAPIVVRAKSAAAAAFTHIPRVPVSPELRITLSLSAVQCRWFVIGGQICPAALYARGGRMFRCCPSGYNSLQLAGIVT